MIELFATKDRERGKKMAKRTKYSGYAMNHEAVVERHNHRSSGASGVHSDQNSRRRGVARTNRVGSRSSAKRVAIRDAW